MIYQLKIKFVIGVLIVELVGTPPKTELIKIEIKGAICHINLARSEKYNAMNVQMLLNFVRLLIGPDNAAG